MSAGEPSTSRRRLSIPWIHRCILCKKWGRKSLSWVKAPHMYSTKYYYHPPCLKKVLGQPEEYSHYVVDMALEIHDIYEKYMEQFAESEIKYLSNCQKALDIYKDKWGGE
ncbi:MAG: hypothetical protein ACXABY_22195 [Candidatus Thorarchaeota archaeon]|jgi:hypothetical protein